MAGFLRDGIINLVSVISMCRGRQKSTWNLVRRAASTVFSIYADRHCRTQTCV